jgi:hypothetical protein
MKQNVLDAIQDLRAQLSVIESQVQQDLPVSAYTIAEITHRLTVAMSRFDTWRKSRALVAQLDGIYGQIDEKLRAYSQACSDDRRDDAIARQAEVDALTEQAHAITASLVDGVR